MQGESPFKFEHENPFASEEDTVEIASVAYRYRKWDLDNGIVLVCRCELDGVWLTPGGEHQFLTIKALNEWDSKVIFSQFLSFMLSVGMCYIILFDSFLVVWTGVRNWMFREVESWQPN